MKLRRARAAAFLAAGALLTGGVVAAQLPATADSVGCAVDYTVQSQWTGGFVANVTVTNLGTSTIDGWSLGFDFPDGQAVSQGWSAMWSQSGAHVTAGDLGWNATLVQNGSASIGFVGTFASANTNPTAFTLNGMTCTGSTVPDPTPTSSPTATATATSTPTATATSTTTTATPTTTTTTATPTPTTTTTAPSGSNPGPAVAWAPPSNLASALAAVWAHEEETYNNGNVYAFHNYLWDQVMANQGNINYCVRWESSASVTAAQRDQIEATLKAQFQKWLDIALTENGQGWNGWPYPTVNVNVVGWAVKDRSLLQWNDDSVDIYVGNLDSGGAPQCAPPCGRFFHQDNDYSGCPGGTAHHYDMSLWLTDGFSGGHGGDWGQRLGREYYMNNISATDMYILLHEIGHGWGLDDFYDWDPGVGGFIMMAGSSRTITEFDKWMLRDWWRHFKDANRYAL